MEYLPTAEELEEYLPEILTEERGEVAAALKTSSENLERLVQNDPTAIALIERAKAEVQALLDLRTLMLAPTALDTLEDVMVGRVSNTKLAMARVRAAEGVLDRNPATAKVSRNSSGVEQGTGVPQAIIPLETALENVPQDDRVAVMDRYMSMVDEIEAFRTGDATKVVNVTPGDEDGEGSTLEIQALQLEGEAEPPSPGDS